jgi:tetraacyldisaccharide 4'-kinase
MLSAQGLQVTRTLALPDHVNFDSVDLNEFKGYTVVCTEKDAVKLWPLLPQAWAVPLQFTPEPAFFKALDGLLADLHAL